MEDPYLIIMVRQCAMTLGVGKLRKPFFKEITGEVGVEMLKAIKNKLDPKNIFATGNLIDP